MMIVTIHSCFLMFLISSLFKVYSLTRKDFFERPQWSYVIDVAAASWSTFKATFTVLYSYCTVTVVIAQVEEKKIYYEEEIEATASCRYPLLFVKFD